MRVIHVASWYPSVLHGSLGNFIERHIRAITASAQQNALVLAAIPVPSDSEHRGLIGSTERSDEVIRSSVLTVLRTFVAERPPVVWRSSSALIQAANRWIAEEGHPPDLIHLHVTYPAGTAARKLANRYGIPLVISEHWTGLSGGHSARNIPIWQKQAMLKTARRAAVLCPVSADLGRGMKRFGMKGQQQVIPNVVDVRRFCPPTKKTHLRQNLLHVSSMLDAQKNVSGMLEAFAHALPNLPEGTQFVLVGQQETEHHRSTAQRLGIEASVVFKGGLDSVAVSEEMRRAFAFVLFSRYENFPCVLPEAWASGLPVIAPAVGGIGEVLSSRPDRGILLDKSATIDDLRRAMLDAFGQVWNREAMRNLALDCFSEEAVGREYTDVYLNCTA